MLPITLTLEVISWTRKVTVGGTESDRLQLSANLINRDEIRATSSGDRNLAGLPWGIELTCGEWTGSMGGMGLASYHPEVDSDDYHASEQFWISAGTSLERYRQVVELLHPAPGHQLVASFDVDGLSYGWEPDGSAVEWNLEQSTYLPIRKASFSLRAIAEATPNQAVQSAAVAHPQGKDVPLEPQYLAKIVGLLRFIAAAVIGAYLLIVFR